MSSSNEPTPILIHIPPSLRHLNLNLQQFLDHQKAHHKTYHMLAVGACIFAPPSIHHPKPRLLLVQRAASERTFPNMWEVPGGSAEFDDPSILHSVARETFEETGLRLTRFVRQVGDGIEFGTPRNRAWIKLAFEIQVAELHGTAPGQTPTPAAEAGEPTPVTLDPEEHQRHAWATEAEIRLCTLTEGPYPIMTEDQRLMMLQAFALHDAGGENGL